MEHTAIIASGIVVYAMYVTRSGYYESLHKGERPRLEPGCIRATNRLGVCGETNIKPGFDNYGEHL